MNGNKELSYVYILEYLKRESNELDPKQFSVIEEMLRDYYGIDYTRQTVAKKVNDLIEGGYLERSGPKSGAYYIDRDFDESELLLLIFSVLSNKSIPPAQANNLVERLNELGGRFFDISDIRFVGKADAVSAGNNAEIFSNLEKLHDAIRNSRKIEFTYCVYDVDGELHPAGGCKVSPYYVAMKNQKFYLMSSIEEQNRMYFFRVGHMKDIKVLSEKITDIKQVKGFEEGLDFNRLVSALPYMFSDKPQNVLFRADDSIINHIIDWFGKEVTVHVDPKNTDKVLANLKTSPIAMKYWALQYLDSVEILAPPELREALHKSLSENTDKYASKARVPKLEAPEVAEEHEERLDDIAPGKLSELNHEFEDPGIKELDYFFNLKAEKLIPRMFKNTDENGILDTPIDPNLRPEGKLGKRYFRCKVEWNREDMEKISEEFKTVRKAISELALHHAELDIFNPDTNGTFSPEARMVWKSFFKGYECEELEKEMEKGVELLIEKELHPERFLENEDDFGPFGRRVPRDEQKLEFIFFDNRELRDKVRKDTLIRFSYDRFIRVRRLYLMYAYDAPETLIEREARRLARYMVLNRYCETYDENYWSK